MASQRERQLEDLVKRHVQEVAVLRQRLPPDDGVVSDLDREAVDVHPTMTDPSIVNPLFLVYDARIEELMVSARSLERDRDALLGDVRRLVRENEDLRLAQLRDFDTDGQGHGQVHGAQGQHQHQASHEVAELSERLAYVEEERRCLLAQKELVVGELESCLKERSDQDELIAALQADLKELAYTRAFLDQTVREKEQAEEAVVAQARRLSEEVARGKSQAEATRLLREEVAALAARLQRAEGETKRVSTEADAASESLHGKVSAFAARVRELQAKLEAKTLEWEGAVAAGKEASRAVAQTSRDNAGMLGLMGSLERQLADFSEREAATEKASAECREACEKALLERDGAVAAEAYLRAELGRLREVRVDEYAERERHHAQALAEARDADRSDLALKEQQIKRLTEANEVLRSGAERSGRERDSVEARITQLSATLDSERRLVAGRCKALEQRVIDAEALAASKQAEGEASKALGRGEVAKLERLLREAERLRCEAEDRRASAEALAAAAEERLEASVCGRDRDRAENASLVAEKEADARQLRRLEGAERDAAAASAAAEELRHAVAEAEVRLADAKALNGSLRDAAAKEREWAKADRAKQEALLLGQLAREREASSRLADQVSKLGVRCAELDADNGEMRGGYAEAVARSSALEGLVEEGQARLNELALQLAEGGAREHASLREQARLKGDIARLRFAVPGTGLGKGQGQSADQPIVT